MKNDIGGIVAAGVVALSGLGIMYAVQQVVITTVAEGRTLQNPGLLMLIGGIGLLALLLGIGLLRAASLRQ